MEKPPRMGPEKPLKKETKKILKRVLNYATAAAIFFGGFGEKVQAQPEKVEDFGTKIENITKENKQKVDSLLIEVKQKGKDHMLGDQFTKEVVTDDGTHLRVGYETPAGENAEWFGVQDKEGNIFWLDKDADGDVDRIIFNSTDKEPERKKTRNYMNAFGDMDGLAEEAGIASDLKPEKIKVFNFDNENKKMEIVDFETGDYGSSDSENLLLGAQEKYGNMLKSIE